MSKNELLASLKNEPEADAMAGYIHPFPCLSCGGAVHVIPVADIELSAGFACENCGEVLYFAGVSSDTGKYLKGWIRPEEKAGARLANPYPDDPLGDAPF
jgi:hypothetical protein